MSARALRLLVATIAVGGVLVGGCSGPIPLRQAIRQRHVTEYQAMTAQAGDDPQASGYAWLAAQSGVESAEIRRRDLALPTNRNPFNARRDADAVSRGAVIFEAHCARCHGEDVRGGGPEMLADHPTKDFHRFEQRFAVTLHGGAPRAWFRKISAGYGAVVEYPDGPSRAMPRGTAMNSACIDPPAVSSSYDRSAPRIFAFIRYSPSF